VEKTPEKTMAALQQKLPREYWIDINRLLVPFGKHICTGSLPKCSICPVLAMCQQVGVESIAKTRPIMLNRLRGICGGAAAPG
jgi:endonuclease III